MKQKEPASSLGTRLRCPHCQNVGVFSLSPHRLDRHDEVSVACSSCGYRIKLHAHGIPDLIEAEHAATDKPFTQKVMETSLFAKIYETPIWRPLHTFVGSGMFISTWVDRLLDLGPRGQLETILDLACGTGHYTRALAARHPEADTYGLDLSLSMLKQGARIHAKSDYSHEPLLFVRGDIMVLPFADASIDQVNCCGALHLFPDLDPIWSEIARVLKPGGVLTGEAVCVNRFIAPLQLRVMSKGKASFFERDWLESALAKVGLGDLHYEQHRLLALFRATRGA